MGFAQRLGIWVLTWLSLAIAAGLGISIDHIRQGLRTFATTFYQAPGRLNIFDELGFRVIVDYAHNPAAMRAMGDLIKQMNRPRKVGLVAVAGDRRDTDIRELGQVAAEAFDELIIKEDEPRRGRDPGEVAAILRDAAIEAGLSANRVKIVLNEIEAIDMALGEAQSDDLIVIFADDIIAVWKQVTKWRPRHIAA